MSNLEQQAREMSRQAALGSPTVGPVVVPPAPLRHFAGSIVLVLLGLAGLVWGGVELAGAGRGPVSPLGVGLVVTGLLFLAPGAFLLYRRLTERCVVTLHETGVAVERFGRRSVFPLGEIDSLSLSEKEHLDSGVRSGLLRGVELRGGPGRVRFRQLALDAVPDALGPLLQGLRSRLASAAEERLRGGAALTGSRWTLDGAGFLARPGAVPVPLAEITQVGVFQDKVSLWAGNDEQPFASIPAHSPNAWVLHDLLWQRLSQQGARPRGPEDGLGRVLFEKRSGSAVTIALAVLALGLLAAAVSLFADHEAGVGAGAAALGLLAAYGALHTARARFRCHERGLVKRGPLGERMMRYADLEQLSYGAVRHYHNGVYTGTHITMSFACADGKPIRHGAQTRGSEADLEMLRDQLAGMIARRLYERVGQVGEVPWTGTARLSPKGVHYRRKKLLGKGEETLAGFDQDLRFSIESGFFHLFLPGEKKSVLDLPCGGTNFYPGFLLFKQLAADAQGADAGRPEA